jgi:dTDP-4-amino-4,6-dideoxygalactose transaminase
MKPRTKIPILIPSSPTSGELAKYLKMIDKNRKYSNFGPLYFELVHRLSKYFNVSEDNLVLLSNATLAIAGAINTAKVKDKRWLTPSWTFAATPMGILQGGGVPKFVDINKEWRAEFKKSKGNILDVLPFGDGLRESYEIFNRDFIVIDAAASFDALKNIKLENSRSIAIIISMHATKLISAGEGGIFLTNDSEWAARVRTWSNFGFKTGSRTASGTGINAKMSEYNAAIGLASMDGWSNTRKQLLDLTETVVQMSHSYGFGIIPSMSKRLVTPYWIIKFGTKEQKLNLSKEFMDRQIETRNWWESGCHQMPAFQKFQRENLVKTLEAYETEIANHGAEAIKT